MVKKRPFGIKHALTGSRHGRPSLRIGGLNGIAMLPTIDTINKWKAQRGAVLHFKFDDRQQSIYEEALKKYEDFVVYMEKI